MINEDQIIPYQTSDLPVKEGPWLVFAPHADDETFGMGGTILKAVERGIKISLVVMTDGALGGNQQDLVQIRKFEAMAACSALGIEKPVFLGNQDRNLEVNDVTLEQTKEQILRVSPAAIFFPGAFELHPDHRTTAALVWQAVQQMDQDRPIPVAYEVLTQSLVNSLVDITPYMIRKEAVMALYTSQLAENRYIDIAKSLNRLRSLTLPVSVVYAEGFFRYQEKDLECGHEAIQIAKIRTYFEP